MLAAAVFIGCGLWITDLYIQKGHEKPAVAVQSIPAKQIPAVLKKLNVPPKKEPVNTIVHSTDKIPDLPRQL